MSRDRRRHLSCPVTITRGVVSARAVVMNYPPYAILAGNPCRVWLAIVKKQVWDIKIRVNKYHAKYESYIINVHVFLYGLDKIFLKGEFNCLI